MVKLRFKTLNRCEFLDITGEVAAAVSKAGITDGIVLIFCPHTTAGITINENADPSVLKDITMKTSKFINYNDANYRHGEGNSDSHIKSSLVGASETVIVEDRRLVLGTWQSIFLAEFDGPRTRDVILKVVPG